MIEASVDNFLNIMKIKYPQYSFDYIKHDNGEYEIMHNYENEDNDEQFSDYAFDLFKYIFIDNKVYNVGFCYDYDFANISK